MAQPFDFASLLNDPTFQFGATLMSTARQPNSIGNAFSQVQKVRDFKQQQEYQQAQIKNMEETRRISQEQYERQNSLTQMQVEKQQRQMQMQENFMQQMQEFLHLGSPQGQQQEQAPQPQMQPQGMPLGEEAITPQLMDSLAQVESSGNPNAINSQSGAAGLMQFMPATARQLGIDPMNPAQAKPAAKRYLQNLTRQNGGSLERGLAAYGGFKTKDPTPYIQKVLSGAGVQPQQPQAAPGGPVNMGGGLPNRGLDIARLAAGAGVAGIPGAAQVMELGKMMAPQNVPAGSYQRDPSTGAMQYIQDPMRTAELAQGAQRVGLEGQRVGMEGQRLGLQQQQQQYEMGSHPGQLPQKALDAVNSRRYEAANTEIDKSHEVYKELPNQFHALERAQKDVTALIQNKNSMTPIGFAGATKLAALKMFSNTFGHDAPKEVVNAEDFNSAMAQLWMKAVKQVDQNPTANQQKSIMASFGTLANDPHALEQILGQTKISFVKQMQRHNKAVAQFQKSVGSQDPYSRFLDTGETTPAGTPVGGEEDGHIYLGGPVNASTSWTK